MAQPEPRPAGQRRWRNDPGLPADKWNVTKRGGWYYATAKPKKGKATAKPAAKKPARPPLTFKGDDTLRGGWKNQQDLNPENWVQEKGLDGRYYAVKRTELTGLDPTSKATIRDFDTQTTGQLGQITGAYDQYANDTQTLEANRRQALADYARNSGFVQNPDDPTAAAVGRAVGQSATAAGGPDVVRGLDLPAVLRAAGQSQATGYQAQRTGQRAELLGGLRQAMAEQEAARQKAASDLRGQNLTLLSTLAGQDASTQRALIGANTQLAGIDAQNQRTAATIEGQNARTAATLDSQERRTLAKIQENRKVAAAKAKAKRNDPTKLKDLAKQARKMAEGIPYQGKGGTQYIVYTYGEVVRWLMSAGLNQAQASRIADGTPGLQKTGGSGGGGF